MTENETKENSLVHLENYLKDVPKGTRIYIGCDSERIRKNNIWWADYCVVVVVHKGGNNGCRIFGEIVRERDFDQKRDKPRMRLMNEVYKVAELYLENFELLEPFDPEIHLDINPNEHEGSNCVITEATGYIRGVCGLEPKVKPAAFSASYAADRFAYLTSQTSKKKSRRNRRKIERRRVARSKQKGRK